MLAKLQPVVRLPGAEIQSFAFELDTVLLSGQVYAKHAALARFAFHRDLSAVLVDDFGTDRQSQPHAVRLGGEERIEDGVHQLGFDALPAVDHRDLGVAARQAAS